MHQCLSVTEPFNFLSTMEPRTTQIQTVEPKIDSVFYVRPSDGSNSVTIWKQLYNLEKIHAQNSWSHEQVIYH